ncbi:hypothetical protein Pla175_48110 [Pirellulimonas nuda]|uniref:Uncharacterized protein n=1 Tax=Pirellulimonas nuda TaxID=2528009 RepID=A0A518DIT2_9BACT|nr:PEP-CTERM sorting domain-containing protein [Pirellulimonas nuda]QDU91389.1 hypothetical protein Pla175_48110 [Pirellulimonas nuda]
MRTLPALLVLICLVALPVRVEAIDLSQFNFSQKVHDALAKVQARVDEARSKVANLPSYTIPSFTIPTFNIPSYTIPTVHIPTFPIPVITHPLDACQIADSVQGKFETDFSGLQMDYDDGLANISDFFESPEYTAVVSGVEHLISKHDIFLNGVELSIDALGRPADALNRSISRFDDLVNKIGALNLPGNAAAHVEAALGLAENRVLSIRDRLLEPQMALAGKLEGYQEFNTEMQDYLDSIIDAASENGTEVGLMTSVSAAGGVTLTNNYVYSLPVMSASATSGTQLAVSGAAVPEPAAWVLLLGVAAAAGTLRRKR